MSDTYGVSIEEQGNRVPAPELPYRPPTPQWPTRPIGVIGCGAITREHLKAYRNAGFQVALFCSRDRARADAYRAEFYPEAEVCDDWKQAVLSPRFEVADITAHPAFRAPLIRAALDAGKHVLSQKPLALDIKTAADLEAHSRRVQRSFAVNQNGRWAPHHAWMRHAIAAGLVGSISTVEFSIRWDHHWICGTPFEDQQDLILFDFGIHWFDLARVYFGGHNPHRVYAASARSPGQRARPPFLAHALIEWESGQARLAFNADTAYGAEDATCIVGTLGTLRSVGPNLMEQSVTLVTEAGLATPVLTGAWFPDGFQGAMAELLCAIEQEREPIHSAADNLRTLRLCFAAQESAATGLPVDIA